MATDVTFKHQLQSALLNLTVSDLLGQSTNEYNNYIYDVNYSNQNMVFSSFFFFRKNYLLLSCATSVRPSVRLSVRPSVRLSVCPSVEIISFRGNSLSNRPIELKIGLNVREGVVHVR